MTPVTGTALLLYAAVAVVALVVLIVRYKLNPFVTLLVVSLLLGVAVGMPMGRIVEGFEKGVGNVLGHVALVVALGTMLGKMMAESGGAARIANTLIGWFGERNVHWAMASIAFLVGLPVFFEVGFVLLVPIAFNVARRTGTSMVLVGIPMVAGLSVVHGLVPPHPAALMAVNTFQADIGKTVLFALIVGIPTAALAGPLFAKLVSAHVQPDPDNPLADQLVEQDAALAGRELPGFAVTVGTILLPVLLMLVGSWSDLLAPAGSVTQQVLALVGHPVSALLLATLLSYYTFGKARGFDRATISRFSTESLAPTAAVLMVVGAGGGFGGILRESGIAAAVVELATGAQVPLLLLGWLVAAMIRVATGSATVALVTAAGILAPLAAGAEVRPELLVIASGAGSLVLSHVNDGGFWLVKEYFHFTVPETFKTWTVCETIISVVALALTMALSTVV
jgi:GntP family gluconate:H+ symporter